MQSLFEKGKYCAALVVLILFPTLHTHASDIIDITPITNKILLIVFDDGTVNYPNDLQVERLVLDDAVNVASYAVSSSDDSDFSDGLSPFDIGRKSKGTEFVKSPPWGGNSSDPRSKPWASKHFIYLFLDKELKSGYTYTLNTGDLAANGSEWTFSFEEVSLRSESVHVNTIGYETDAPKYGYVYQWMGDKGGVDLTSYSGKAFHIYRLPEDPQAGNPGDPVLSGTLRKRKSALNAETGQPNDTPDRNFLGSEVYECDFSSITNDGTYILVVEDMGCSYPFKIGTDALWDAYYTVGRALYYQRSGIRLAPPYTDSGYIRPVNQNTQVTSDDGTDFSGQLLYSDFPFTSWDNGDGGGSSKQEIRDAAEGNVLDVAGWYHDAGDWDGYYSHQRIPILLMTTFELFPERFADGDLNLPESGNGIPDIVDEASWLIKFNYRLRKELMEKGYSDGGVGGARICPDVYNEVEGNAQNDKPSWQDYRHYVVTQADPFMTFFYAGQAAQFAVILKNLGKDPHAFPVEMLDHVDFDQMTYDTVDWEQEARDAFEWAWVKVGISAMQPYPNKNYSSDVRVYMMYAAFSLYRLTDDDFYLGWVNWANEEIRNKTRLDEDERYGVYSYLLADNYGKDPLLHKDLVDVIIGDANFRGLDAADKRACRWGSVFDMPMLIGQATTPRIFECMVAYGITGREEYLDVAHTTADYFLGNNPLHSTWATHLGPRPAEAGFHLDSRYNNDWVVYPGFIPYGPWSMAYGYDPYTWTIDGVEYEGGAGPWNKDWANFSQYPFMSEWPGHERWNSNIHAPMSTENTVHQNTVYGFLTYGFVNNRENENGNADIPLNTITLNKTDILLDSVGAQDTLSLTIDVDNPTFSALKWASSDPRVAHVDRMGRVTGVTAGSCVITVSTLDGSVSASANVTCSWDEVAVDSIRIAPDSITIVEGQTALLDVFFSPDSTTNRFVDWSYSVDGVVEVDENGILTTVSPGVVQVIATSLSGAKRDTCFVTIEAATDYVIVDFDHVVPVTNSVQPDVPQLYTPSGTSDIAAANPMFSLADTSETVLRYSKPEGDYKLFGIALPTQQQQPLDRYSQLQFKYYGSDIEEFYIQLKNTENDDNYEINAAVEGEDAWQLFTYNLDMDFTLKQMNVFVNPRGDKPAMTGYFDDFLLAAKPAVYYDGLNISDESIDLASGDAYVLIAEADGHPFTWVSTDTTVVQVSQDGKVTALARGTAEVKAIPLYGDSRACMVDVDGGAYEEPENYETQMILDFESYELDWSEGFGAFSWATETWSKAGNPETNMINESTHVFSWDRGASFGGGFGIGFPAVSTLGWARLSMMVYASSAVDQVQLEFYDDTTLLSTYKSEISVPAHSWTQLVFSLEELELLNKQLTKVHFMPGAGTQEEYNVLLDNVWLEQGTNVPAKKVYLEIPESRALGIDSTLQLEATVSPVNAIYEGLSWSSSVTPVASVSSDGLVTGLAEGTATISAIVADNPAVTDAIQLDIVDYAVAVSKLRIEGDSILQLNVDSTIRLSVAVLPENATDQSVLWTSDEPDVAMVSAEGMVTGIHSGTAIIKATSKSNQEVYDQVSVAVFITGIAQKSYSDLSIYPTPVRDQLTIRSENQLSSIDIYNITGRRVFSKQLNGMHLVTLDNLSLSDGVYIIRIQTVSQQNLMQRFIVTQE